MNRIATIGFFDGVHRGHHFLFDQLRREAQARGLEPLIVTFDQHPRAVLQSDYMPHLLTTPSERVDLLHHIADAEVLVLPFADIQALTAEQFMQFLASEHNVNTLLMGYDHRFGSDRLAHLQAYVGIGERMGVHVLRAGEWQDGELHISSTEIRSALEHGNIVLANEMLGYAYRLSGMVEHGKGIGRTIGFPTANIHPVDPQKIIPRNGVYGVHVDVQGETNSALPAMCNIGTNPTLGTNAQTIEVHIPGFQGDLYGRQLTIHFVRFIREEKRFDTLQALQQQITEDCSSVTR